MSMRSTYRKIAKENGITVAEVKQEIQAALNVTYKNPPDDGVTIAYQNRVPRKDNIPTPDEFIRYAVSELRNKTIE